MDIIVDSFMQNFPQKINLLGKRLIHSAVIIALIVALYIIEKLLIKLEEEKNIIITIGYGSQIKGKFQPRIFIIIIK